MRVCVQDIKIRDLIQNLLVDILVFEGSDKISRGCPRINGGGGGINIDRD